MVFAFVRLCSLFGLFGLGLASSYFPPYLEGSLQPNAQVVTLDPPDIRGEPVYRINFDVYNQELKQILPGMVHRTYKEFVQLDEEIVRVGPRETNLNLPSEADANVETLNQYLQELISYDFLLTETAVEDFMGINWSGQDFLYMNSLSGFMDMLLFHRVPIFMPEPVYVENEMDVFAPETPFEAWVFIMSFRHDKKRTDEYLQFLSDYTDLTPGFEGPEDNSDVWYPGQTEPMEYPYHYNFTYVHFLPGGYMNGHTVRLNYLGMNKFSFLNESRIREWIVQLYPDINPTRIIDIGTGSCFSAFVLAELFPEAEVIGVDMSAPAIRFCRLRQEVQGTPNVQFYQANGEDLWFLEDNSFDFVNYAYVLHEMPVDNAKRVINEMYRILKPGGLLNGFEVPYLDDPTLAGFSILFNTWGYDWDVPGKHGPEPYIEEYMHMTKLPQTLEQVGFTNVDMIPYSFFESIFLSTKPSV